MTPGDPAAFADVEAFPGFEPSDAPAGVGFRQGKVRDIFELDDSLLIVTSDRISAFDRVLGLVPAKGEVLTQISAWWFDQVADIVAHHMISTPVPRCMHVKKCRVLPVELVVRGYLTGSAWRDYRSGRPVSGIELPPGMRFNQRFDEPLITPSTKAEAGAHDTPVSGAEVVKQGLVEPEIWNQVTHAALELFQRGSEVCSRRGLILVDTKYEFGICDGELTVVDELHTPDSSRFWFADSYQERFENGEQQQKLDKEYLRQWLMDRGFQGDGVAPEIPREVFAEVAVRYRTAFETITGQKFAPSPASVEALRQKTLLYIAELQQEQGGGRH